MCELSPKTLRNIKKSLKEIEEGKTITMEELGKRLGIDKARYS